MATFLGLIAEDNRNGTKSENLVAMGKSAYEKTLKPYHTWIVQKVFNVSTRGMDIHHCRWV